MKRSALRRRVPGPARPDEPLAAWCEAQVPGVCTGRAEHRHHRLRRSQGGNDEQANTADLCCACHAHVHANPTWAYDAGWLRRAGAVLEPSRPWRNRYWPTGIDPPRLPDGTVDIRALCAMWDNHSNRGLEPRTPPDLAEAIEVVRQAGYPIPDPWPDD